MNTLPKIGQRVVYKSDSEYDRDRTCQGTVVKFYKKYDYGFDDNDEPIPGTERIRPEKDWHVCMRVDRPLPSWWAYGDKQDQFCPTVSEVELLPA